MIGVRGEVTLLTLAQCQGSAPGQLRSAQLRGKFFWSAPLRLAKLAGQLRYLRYEKILKNLQLCSVQAEFSKFMWIFCFISRF